MLTTSQIEQQLRGVHLFAGVFACDRLPTVTTFPATLIANTDPSNEPGEHWVAIHLRDGRRAEYFCPFGFPPLVPELQLFLSRYGSAGLLYNQCTMQDVVSTLCGDYCICFVSCVARGQDLSHFVSRFVNRATGESNEGMLTCLTTLSR